MIGIDRLKIINVSIISIDLKRFRGHLISGEGVKVYETNLEDYIEFSELDITIKGKSLNEVDNYLMKLKLNRFPYLYFSIDINAPRVIFGTNERNISNKEELEEVFEIVKEKFSNVGIEIDIKDSVISAFEVNYNMDSNKLIDSFKLIKKALSKTENKIFSVDYKEETESIMFNLSDRKIKIYNKSRQLEDSGQISQQNNLVRVEVSTTNTMLIRRLCKSKKATIKSFINNLDDIKMFYVETVNRNLKKVINSYVEELEKNIYQRFMDGEKYFDVLVGVSVSGHLADIIVFDNALKRYYKATNKKKPNTIIKNYHKKLKRYDDNLYKKIKNNLSEINKLFEEIEVNSTTFKNSYDVAI